MSETKPKRRVRVVPPTPDPPERAERSRAAPAAVKGAGRSADSEWEDVADGDAGHAGGDDEPSLRKTKEELDFERDLSVYIKLGIEKERLRVAAINARMAYEFRKKTLGAAERRVQLEQLEDAFVQYQRLKQATEELSKAILSSQMGAAARTKADHDVFALCQSQLGGHSKPQAPGGAAASRAPSGADASAARPGPGGTQTAGALVVPPSPSPSPPSPSPPPPPPPVSSLASSLFLLRDWAKRCGVPEALLERVSLADVEALAGFTAEDVEDDMVGTPEERKAVLEACGTLAAWIRAYRAAEADSEYRQAREALAPDYTLSCILS